MFCCRPFPAARSLVAPGRRCFSRNSNYYKILGVPREATQADVKKAYAKLAREFHPDKNPSPEAKEKFTAINEAYATLNDESKRKVYNSTGMNADEQKQSPSWGDNGSWMNDFDMNDFFRYQSGRHNPYEETFWANEEDFGPAFKTSKKPVRGADIQISVELNFFEAVNKTIKEVSYRIKDKCGTCKGSMCRPGTHPTKCGSCGGKGTINFRQGMMQIQMGCATCKTSGTVIKNPCQVCRGKGVAMNMAKEKIEFPRGVSDGQNLRVAGKGNLGENGGARGDLLIKIKVKEDSFFKREGADVFTEVSVPVYQAVLGGSVEVRTLMGKRTITIPPGTSHGSKIRLAGEGLFKLPPNDHMKGDHFIVVGIEIPKDLSPDTRVIFDMLKAVAENGGVAPGWLRKPQTADSTAEKRGRELFQSFESLFSK